MAETKIEKAKASFPKAHDVEYGFRIRRHAPGDAFANLWDLDVKRSGSDEFEVVVHADSLSIIVDKIGYLFEKDGY